MSLAERPTHEGRPRLTLPRSIRLAAQAAPQPRRPTSGGGKARRASESHDASKLGKVYLTRKLAALAEILGTHADALPPILCRRVPVPLKVGIRADLAARFPGAESDAIGRWLAGWTVTDQYQMQVAAGGVRRDLDGEPAGDITPEHAETARERLQRARD
ncbi:MULTISPECIES: ProQ/FINO family protein [Rhodomicrobium]|uniref:ProQ/FINO family protein n=1 Tax=Rhodomicrobium TaxID=1068 RepID=UPI000B4AD3D7|nr:MULTISPECIES: ProQ/FINO family protein [Rhodomicrobium]